MIHDELCGLPDDASKDDIDCRCWLVQAVKDRIIKMLENPQTMSNWWAMPDRSLGLYGNLKNYVIALIKGENK